MICPHCGQDYSDKVYRIHKDRCRPTARQTAVVHTEENHTKDELIELADLAGVDIDKRWSKHRIVEALNGR